MRMSKTMPFKKMSKTVKMSRTKSLLVHHLQRILMEIRFLKLTLPHTLDAKSLRKILLFNSIRYKLIYLTNVEQLSKAKVIFYKWRLWCIVFLLIHLHLPLFSFVFTFIRVFAFVLTHKMVKKRVKLLRTCWFGYVNFCVPFRNVTFSTKQVQYYDSLLVSILFSASS